MCSPMRFIRRPDPGGIPQASPPLFRRNPGKALPFGRCCAILQAPITLLRSDLSASSAVGSRSLTGAGKDVVLTWLPPDVW